MPFKTLTDEQLAKAKEMLDGGSSVADVSEATGISKPTIYKRFKTKQDPRPGGRAHKKASKPGPTDEQLTSTFTKVAVAPTIPAGLWLKCDYCAGHFVRTGPDAATKLVELSHDHPALRNVMETIWKWGDEIAWAGIIGLWLGVPIAHHASPDWLYRWIAPVMSMPPRNAAAGNGHVHTPPAPADGDVTPPFNPLMGMDAETLMRMAEGFGVQFGPVPNGNDATTATEPPADAEATAEDDAEASETSATDSDGD